jgi:tripartite motif-containing protein 71
MKKRALFRLTFAASLLLVYAWTLNAQQSPVLLKQWGEFGEKPGQMKYPTMIAVDKSSNVYVVDQHNQRIQKFDSEGNFILMWGKLGAEPGEFTYPYGIAVDSKGNVYVSDMNNNRIQKFSPKGDYLASIGSYGTEDGKFKYPYGIAVDEKDIVYVIDAFNYRIQKFTSDLKFLSKWGSEESIGFKAYMPHEIAIAKDGNVILSDRQNHRMSVFSKDGALVKRFGDYGEGKEAKVGQFSEPHGIAVSAKGDLYVCDRYNFRIQVLSANGEPQAQWLTSGVFDDSKQFPIAVAAGPDGCVYVVDHYAHCIQKYKP